jgi:branched-subunit amino acid transport protein
VSRVWVTILTAAAGTFAMRASFLSVAAHLVTLPPWVRRVLRQIPPAALATLVVPAFVRPHGELDVVDARLAAGVVAAAVAWRTRNSALTIAVGMAVLVLLDPWW